MKYVLDSCVGLKWVLEEPGSEAAVHIRDLATQGIYELIAPDVFPIEVAHSIARSERRGIVEFGDGSLKMADVLRHLPRLIPYFPFLKDAFKIASEFRIGVYDCLYVVLAEREGCELITADERLMKNLGSTYPFIRSLADFP
jgi:predicted nucleic acid-binding protein